MTESHTNDESGAGAAYGSATLVWDRGVRVFHWLLVLCVLGALLTGLGGDAETIDIHVILGTAIGALIVFRLIWGFAGTTYARFGSFVPGPRGVFHHAGELLRGGAPQHTGHNPVGSAMILALLATLTAIIATGVIVLGGAVKEGPLAPFLTFAAAAQTKTVHELLAFLLMGLIGLHIAGVLAESWRTRENLVRAMMTGRKLAREDARQAVRSRPVSAVLVFAGIGALAAGTITHFSLLPAYGVPDKPMDTVYAKECGSCHSPHHPSIAPAVTWSAIMAGLDHHFGENASLDPAVTASLSAYLAANSAEKYDTWPANRLRTPSPADPLRITETRGWKRIHHELPDAVFKWKTVSGKLNCSKCHRDAETGRFAPRAIAIPRETASK
jgi:cytochrome b